MNGFLMWNQEQQIAPKIAPSFQGSKQGICDKSASVANTNRRCFSKKKAWQKRGESWRISGFLEISIWKKTKTYPLAKTWPKTNEAANLWVIFGSILNDILQGLKKFGFKILTWIESGRIAWWKINHYFFKLVKELEDNFAPRSSIFPVHDTPTMPFTGRNSANFRFVWISIVNMNVTDKQDLLETTILKPVHTQEIINHEYKNMISNIHIQHPRMSSHMI